VSFDADPRSGPRRAGGGGRNAQDRNTRDQNALDQNAADRDAPDRDERARAARGRNARDRNARDRGMSRGTAGRRSGGPRQAADQPRKGDGPPRSARTSPASGGRDRTGARGRPGGGGRRRGVPPVVFYGTAAGLGVVLLAAVVILVLAGGSGTKGPARPPGPAAAGSVPAAYSDAPSTPTFDVIGERSADSGPLTADEVFPPGRTTLVDGTTHARLELRDQRIDTDCAEAVWGSAAGAVLQQSGCTQAVRGVYADQKKGYAALYAVFNLAHAVDAGRFVHAITPGTGAGFVRPLPEAAPLDGFGRGFGIARGAAMGHYAVVAWVQRLDGSGDAKDQSLISLLVTAGNAPAVYGRVAAHR
jgi:hypothetical protein